MNRGNFRPPGCRNQKQLRYAVTVGTKSHRPRHGGLPRAAKGGRDRPAQILQFLATIRYADFKTRLYRSVSDSIGPTWLAMTRSLRCDDASKRFGKVRVMAFAVNEDFGVDEEFAAADLP